MGLDCIPLGRAKPGHEEEWARLMRPLYEDRDATDAAKKRLQEISLAAWEVLDAPRVGHDPEADAWALKHKDPDSDLTDEEFLRDMEGYHVVELLRRSCDGVPVYTMSAISDHVDATSFQGSMLEFCEGLLPDDLLYQAWTPVMPPEDAVAYGQALLEAAEGQWTEPPPPPPPPPPGFLARLFGRKPGPAAPEPPPTEEEIDEMRDILRAAGRWYVFWGERGHPIQGWS